MSTAVMTRRAFDTRGNLADQLFRCLETPYSDVLKHNTVPATKKPGQRIFPLAWFRLSVASLFLLGIQCTAVWWISWPACA
jgi:hypothetical protein